MAKVRDHASALGFSISIPDGWAHSENADMVDLSAKEQKRQDKWLNFGKDVGMAEKAFLAVIEIVRGLATGVQGLTLMSRRVHYEAFLGEFAKGPVDVLARDRTIAAQMKFLLAAHEEALKDWPEITATTLLITLQRMTDSERLQATRELHSQLGFFTVADDNSSDSPYMTVLKLGMRGLMSANELYTQYRKSLPVWFWSGIPDKVAIVGNRTVDGGRILSVENFLTYSEVDSIDAYGVTGTTGWVISCRARRFPRYKGVFTRLVDSFRVER